jgi:hypothetical protein
MQTKCYLCDLSYNYIEYPPSENDYINIQYKCFKNFFSNRFRDYDNKSYQYYLESFVSAKHTFPSIPLHYQNEYISTEAVLYNGLFIKYVREDLISNDLCIKAIISKPDAFINIPLIYQTDNICNEAISIHGRFIQYVRDDLKTLDLCIKAVSTFPPTYKYVPYYLKTPENNELFLEQNKKVAQFISKYP